MNILPTEQSLAKAWPAMSASIPRPPVTPRGVARSTDSAPPRQYLSLWKGLMDAPRPAFLTMASIVADVAKRHRLTVVDLRGPSRYRPVAWPRQEAMWMMVETGRFSLPQIGRYLGGRDHTTILHGWRQHAKRLAQQQEAA